MTDSRGLTDEQRQDLYRQVCAEHYEKPHRSFILGALRAPDPAERAAQAARRRALRLP